MIEVKFVCDYSSGEMTCGEAATRRITLETPKGVRRDIDVCDNHKREMAWILVDNSSEDSAAKIWSSKVPDHA